jgi:hypothetical protein
MFTWICPQCGCEVPPSESECPRCAGRAAAPPPQATPDQAPPQPPQAAPQQQPVYVIGGQQPARQRSGAPAWLGVVLTIVVIGGGLFGLYKFVEGRKAMSQPAAQAGAPAPVTQVTGSHPFAKHIELVGIRLLETDDKKPLVRFVVVNHSPAEFSGLALRINFTASSGEPIAVVDAPVGTVPAYGIKDMEAPLATKLRIYELPDWQFVRASAEITAPR